MAKQRTLFVCDDCGVSSPRWAGQCGSCGAWNALKEMRVASGSGAASRPERAVVIQRQRALPLADVTTADLDRVVLPLVEINRVLGGGVVPGGVVLLGGEPGIGKSTLILQAADMLAQRTPPVLYVSGEESPQQIKVRAERLGLSGAGLHLLSETNLDAILDEVDRLEPRALIIDSIQTVHLDSVTSAAGSVTQVRECGSRLARLAKTRHTPVFLIGHVTKSGDLAGPRVLEHMVDIVLQLEGDRHHSYRLLRGIKNRFGSTHEVGVFEMRGKGMIEVPNPSAAFLAERLSGVPGSAVTVTLEGTRPLLVEVQALVSPTGGQGPPRRMANGIDLNRLLLLAAVLTRRLGLPLGNHDIFVNVVGGLRVGEPSIDLAVALAIVSSARGQAIDAEHVVFGEVGLSGEVRSVGHVERRLAEAAKLGFPRAVVPEIGLPKDMDVRDMQARGVRTLGQAIDAVLAGDASG